MTKALAVPTMIRRLSKLEKENEDLKKQLASVQRFSFNSTEPFQLLVNIKGKNKSYVRQELVKLLNQMDEPYGKPRQGIISSYGGEIDIVTRLWNGEVY